MSRNKLELRSNSKFLIDSSNSFITSNYDLEKTVGQGHFAIVKSARHIFSGERVAIKIIDKLKLDSLSREHLFQEVKCMKLVQHPNVVRLYEVIDTNSKLYLIQEFGNGGDMYDYIMKHSDGLDEEQAKSYFRQIVNAIKYCHDLKVVHRDLKPENVVFFQETGQVKLTDFGFSNVYEPDVKLLTSCGSLAYSAPEILLGDSYYAPPVDIWSLGVILYMLVTGRAPFQEANDSETLMMILDCKFYLPEYLSPECSDLISRMIVRDPNKRISLDEIKYHAWFVHKNNESAEEDIESSIRRPLSESDRDKIMQLMIDGEICKSKQVIEENLKMDNYNYITATFYLLAENMTRSEHKKRKIFPTASSKRKPLIDLQQPSVTVSSSSVLSKNQFKLNQRNLLMRQTEAKEEDEELVEEIEEEEVKEDENDIEAENLKFATTNLIEDKNPLNYDETGQNNRIHIQLNHALTRRSSRGASISQSDNLISKLTIPEEEPETDKESYLNFNKNPQDSCFLKSKTALNIGENTELASNIAKFKPPKLSTDTSDSETEQTRAHEWARSTSSTSRSRTRLRSNNNFTRPLSVSSENEHHNSQLGQTLFSSKTLSVEHRLANMSQMSISSQLSKNNSFRHHRSTITGSETPAQIYSQQISSTTPTPRESVVFNRGDDKPIVKLLQQMNYKSKSMDQNICEFETRTEMSPQAKPNNDSYTRAIKQSTIPFVNNHAEENKIKISVEKISEGDKINEISDKDVNFVEIKSTRKKKKSLFSSCCVII